MDIPSYDMLFSYHCVLAEHLPLCVHDAAGAHDASVGHLHRPPHHALGLQHVVVADLESGAVAVDLEKGKGILWGSFIASFKVYPRDREIRYKS